MCMCDKGPFLALNIKLNVERLLYVARQGRTYNIIQIVLHHMISAKNKIRLKIR